MIQSVRAVVVVFTAALISTRVHSANFSCSFGRGACLDYGDTVWSTGGKCVQSTAVCFQSYTCDFKGFACKSDVDKLSAAYDDLVFKAQLMSTDFNKLADENRDLLSKFNDLISDLEALSNKYRRARDCVANATSLDDARACSY